MSLDAVVDLLACPVCRMSLARVEQSLRCPAGHSFDVGRQGHVTLVDAPIRHPGDSVGMVMARERVQASGSFDPITDEVVASLRRMSLEDGPRRADALADVGAGIGSYAVAVLEAGIVQRAVALDSSKPALKRAARAHPSLGAVGCDVVDGLPVRDAAVDVAVVAFAPRNATELARVVRAGGVLVVVTPEPGHLAQLREPMGLLLVDQGKAARIIEVFAGAFEPGGSTPVRASAEVARDTAVDLAQMGPAGFHASRDELEQRAAGLPDRLEVDLAVTVTTLTRRD